MNRLKTAILTVGGLGLIRPGPGTFGSLPPVLLTLLLVGFGVAELAVHLALVLLGLLFGAACIRLGEWAEERFEGKDPSSVVADEVAGQCIVLLLLPWRSPADDPTSWAFNAGLALIAFITFRIFDISKVWPVGAVQRLTLGWGVLVDDLIAGVYAAITTQLLVRIVIPGIF